MTYAYGKNLLPATVGFDRLLSTIEEFDRILGNSKPQSYPPYSILKFDDNNYQIQIAVAGFAPEDVEVETNQNELTICGVSRKTEAEVEYLHHGLATRDFKHTFKLMDTVVVQSANIQHGVLLINVENVIPEERKPRKIPIGNKESLLLEDK